MFVEDLSEAGSDAPSPALSRSSSALVVELPQRERLLSLSEMADLEGKRERTHSSGGSLLSLSQSGSDSRSGSTGALSQADPERLRHTIILSSHDSIVPVGPVSRYLEAKRREGHSCFEVVFFHGHHGEMMLYPSWVTFITKKINERCNIPEA